MKSFLGEFSFRALNQDWTMRFDFNALAAFEEEAKRPALEVISKMDSKTEMVMISDLRLLCWAGLKRHHPDVKLETAGDILSECPQAVLDGINRAMPQEAGTAKAGKQKRATR